MMSTCPLPVYERGWANGASVFALSDGTWALPDVVFRTLALVGPARVDVCTFALSLTTVNECKTALVLKRALGFRFIVHSRMVRARQGRGWASCLRRIGPENFRISDAHAKFVIVRAPGWNVAISTSSNMNPGTSVEHFTWSEGATQALEIMADYFDETFATVPVPKMPTVDRRVGEKIKARPVTTIDDDFMLDFDSLIGDDL